MFEHRSIRVMLPAASLFTTLLLALSIVASPVLPNSTVTLPIARRLNTSNGTISPLDRRASFNVLIMNEVYHYITSVYVGSPQDFTTCEFNLEKNCRCQWIGLYRQLDYRVW